MDDAMETAYAEPRTTVPDDLRREVHGRVSRDAGEALRRLASAPGDCPPCGAAGAVRSRLCEVCDSAVDPDTAAALPPAAASPPPVRLADVVAELRPSPSSGRRAV